MTIHKSTMAHTEVFNNYGLKPNSELILGYGFSLPVNPDDTIVLKVGGGVDILDKTWEVGRNARGAEGLWMALTTLFAQNADDGQEDTTEWECEFEAAETLLGMVERKLLTLPHVMDEAQEGVRGDVLQMIRHYVEGKLQVYPINLNSHRLIVSNRSERHYAIPVCFRRFETRKCPGHGEGGWSGDRVWGRGYESDMSRLCRSCPQQNSF